jgi:hypothetical protein
VEKGWEEEDFWDAINWAYKVECEEEQQLSKGGAYSNVRPLGLTRSQLKGTIESEEHISLFPDAKYSLVKLPTDDDTIELFYREGDDHTLEDLDLDQGILTWDVLIDDVDNVVIDLSATTTSSDIADLSPLITFVEIA